LVPRRAALGREGFAIYNVGTGRETRVLELSKTLGVTAPPVHGPEKPEKQRRFCIASTRLQAELGVSPRVALKEGLQLTAQWFLAGHQHR
jgi:nucleoside-diphosphate-sugar epimerase